MSIKKERVSLSSCQIITDLFFKSVKAAFTDILDHLKSMTDKKMYMVMLMSIISMLNDPFRHASRKVAHIVIAFPTTNEKRTRSMQWNL